MGSVSSETQRQEILNSTRIITSNKTTISGLLLSLNTFKNISTITGRFSLHDM